MNNILDAELIFYCISGKLDGTLCIDELYTNAFEDNECPIGYTISGFKCKKNGTWTDYSKCKSFDYTYDYLDDMCYSEVKPTKNINVLLEN